MRNDRANALPLRRLFEFYFLRQAHTIVYVYSSILYDLWSVVKWEVKLDLICVRSRGLVYLYRFAYQ